MTKVNENIETRKVSDILLSIEEKLLMLVKIIASTDMNNKLILDRLNKMLAQNNNQTISTSNKSLQINTDTTTQIEVNTSISQTNRSRPVANFEQQVSFKPEKTNQETKKEIRSNKLKIPVVQRVSDSKGKDLFRADVVITNKETNEVVSKLKTTATGKWQTYLDIGTYNVHISKISDIETGSKIESLQEFEITPQTKSLQLPIAIIKN